MHALKGFTFIFTLPKNTIQKTNIFLLTKYHLFYRIVIDNILLLLLQNSPDIIY